MIILECELTGTVKKYSKGKWYTLKNGKWIKD